MKNVKTVILLTVFIFMLSGISFARETVCDAGGVFASLKSQRITDDVLVLMYHKLSDNKEEWGDYCMSPQQFEKELLNLKNENYVFYTASELLSAKPEKGKRIVVITFDDGYESDYIHVLPLLKKHNAKATFFVFGQAIGTDGYMSETQLKALSDEECTEIGNHTYNLHGETPEYITKLYSTLKNINTIENDFKTNSDFIEKITGKKVTAASYPYGIYNSAVDLRLKGNGIKITFSSDSKVNNLSDISHPLGRINKVSK